MSITDHPFADADSESWWQALQRGELLIQGCGECGRLRWPARAMCNECGSFEWDWVSAKGSGTVASWTVTHRPSGLDAGRDVVVMVRLDDQDDILIPGYIDGPADGSGLSIDMPVEVGFDDVEGGPGEWQVSVLRWRRLAG